MPIFINNKPFSLYNLDTKETIINRISSILDTTPLYLFIDDNIINTLLTLPTDGNFTVIDILKDIKEDSSSLSIVNIYDKYKDFFVNKKILIKTWLAYNIHIEEGEVLSLAVEMSITEVDPTFDLENFNYLKRKEFKKNIEEGIKKIKKEVKETEEEFIIFEQIIPKKHTEFTLDVITFSLYINLTGYNIYDVFNSLKLNIYVPFTSLNSFYKILKGFKPPEEWNISLKDNILLKVLVQNKYKDAFFQIIDNKVVLTTELSKKEGENTINYILSTLNIENISIEKEEEEKIKGDFYYIDQSIDKFIFADLVMNDPIFSKYLSIDESQKLTKEKPSIYAQYLLTNNETVSIVLTSKYLSPEEIIVKDKDLDTTIPYLKVRISNVKNKNDINDFIDKFSKIISIYNIKYPEYLKEYLKYLPNYLSIDNEREAITDKVDLKYIAPKIFYTGYSKKCSKSKKPVIVSEGEALKYPLNKRLFFPTKGEDIGRYYVCKNPEYVYPGLFINNLENSELFPYLPCCYKKDQTKSKSYREYFEEDKQIARQDKEQQNILKSNKTCVSTGFGYLPKELQNIFKLIDIDNMYLRSGVSRSKSSFIECILKAFYKQTGFLSTKKGQELNDNLRRERTLTERLKIANWKGLVVGRQQMYNYTVDQIQKELLDTEIYISPQKYTKILEDYFMCNIFVFSRENDLTMMQIPNYAQIYLKYPLQYENTIIIYEHMGSSAQYLTYPQCEVIVNWNRKDNIPIYYFNINDPVTIEMDKIFDKMTNFYILGKNIGKILLDIPDEFELISQVIDIYGKTRVLNCNYNNEIKSVFTDPIPPLSIPETTDIFYWNEDEIPTDIKTFGEIKVKFLVNNKESSRLDLFNKYYRISRYLTETLYYLFSQYLNKNNIDIVNDNIINDFIKNNIIIIEKPKYISQNKFTKDFTQFMTDDNKLMITTYEILKRIIYVLRLKIRQSFKELKNYKDFKYIQNFYFDVSDFDKYKNQVIVYEENGINNYLLSFNKQEIFFDNIQIDLIYPYFFKNDLIEEGKMFLAQNTDTLEKALATAVTWNQKGFNNRGMDILENIKDLSLILYSYVNRYDIKPYTIIGDKNNYNIKLIGYILNNTINYTVLLDLDKEI